MGIKDFLKIEIEGKTIRSYGHLFGENFVENKKLAVDAFNIIYRARHVIGESLSSGGKTTSHIKIILTMITRFKRSGTRHVWIFDGAKNKLKEECVQKRTTKITTEEIEDIQNLLTLCGISYYVVSIEAEFFAAELCKRGAVDWVLSSDTDVIVRGGNLLKDEKHNGKKTYLAISSSVIMEKTGLTLEDLAKIGVLMGSDFAPKTHGIGPKNVYGRFRNTELTERQKEAHKLLAEPVGRGCILRYERGAKDLERLQELLTRLEFSRNTISKALTDLE
jgi:5'-3' exonuclease